MGGQRRKQRLAQEPHHLRRIALRLEADAALDFAQEHRFNAIFLQIRPTADSLFPSDYFPWSKYLTGTTGVPPENGFDPLAYWIEQAHERGIGLHAWLNPYRITKKEAADPAVSPRPVARDPSRTAASGLDRHVQTATCISILACRRYASC